MAKIDTASRSRALCLLLWLRFFLQNEALPENATTTKLRQLVDSSSVDTLGQDQIRDMVRHHLAENQALLRGLQDRLRQTEGHLELYEQKREDLEAVLAQRNSAYEELLGRSLVPPSGSLLIHHAARQSSELVGTEVIAEIKVRRPARP
jgi:CRP-like cAMP-binding protein